MVIRLGLHFVLLVALAVGTWQPHVLADAAPGPDGDRGLRVATAVRVHGSLLSRPGAHAPAPDVWQVAAHTAVAGWLRAVVLGADAARPLRLTDGAARAPRIPRAPPCLA